MIEQATEVDLPAIAELYRQARAFMREHGNPNQWTENYPGEKLILADIRQGNCYVYRERGEIVGAFSFFLKPDPTYAHIYHGKWRNNNPYGVVHRLAVAVHGKGIAGACLEYAFSQCRNLRIDTHRDNLPMQRLLEKQGFHFCGIIFLESGAERLAYQKTTE